MALKMKSTKSAKRWTWKKMLKAEVVWMMNAATEVLKNKRIMGHELLDRFFTWVMCLIN